MRAAALLLVAISVAAQQRAGRVVSPDGVYALVGDEPAVSLWLENTLTSQRRLVFRVAVQTLTVAWSPDSGAFLANDREASDREHAYIFDAKTLERLDLRSLILAADPSAVRFVPGPGRAPHSYTHALRWLDATHVETQLHGHTDPVPTPTGFDPPLCFDLRYRISRDGAVQKLSARVAPVTDKGCRSRPGGNDIARTVY